MKKLANKKIILTVVVIVFSILILLFLLYCSLFRYADSVQVFNNKTDITSNVSGKLIELNVENDSEVKEGEILAQIDSSEYKNVYDTALQNLIKAESELKTSSDEINKISNQVKANEKAIKDAKLKLEEANNDYVIYKNAYKDGSVTTTKQITKTVVKEEAGELAK